MDHIISTTDTNDIPAALRQQEQWVLWKYENRDAKPSKVPFQMDGQTAKSNDPTTWTDFQTAAEHLEHGGYEGLGFTFSADDGFCGIDLDGCRDTNTSEIQPWAQELIDRFASYTEVSPSGTGVKIFCKGTNTRGRGGNQKIDAPECSDKGPGIEIYDQGRYFAITGEHLPDTPATVNEAQSAIDELLAEHFTDKPREPQRVNGHASQPNNVERARSYLAKMEPAISGEGGHNRTFEAACRVFEFGLTDSEARTVFAEYNTRCEPPWSEREIDHKLADAREKVAHEDKVGCRLQEDGVPACEPGTRQSAVPTKQIDLQIMTASQFAEANFTVNYLIEDVAVAGQGGIISGRFKTFKTTIACEMAVALASGSPFLGKFAIPTPENVLVLSGESGRSKLRKTLDRICKRNGHRLADLGDRLHISTRIPAFSRPDHVEALAREIERTQAKLAIIDPTYIAFSGFADKASNPFAMGGILGQVNELMDKTGCTFVLVNHNRKNRGNIGRHAPPELEEISMSGFAEWARWWLLLGPRAEPDDEAGQFRLWMRTGGSEGHHNLWALDFNDTPDRYEIGIQRGSDAKKDRERQCAEKKQEEQQAKVDATYTAILDAFTDCPGGATKTAIREKVGNTRAFADALKKACKQGDLVECRVKAGNGQKYDGLKLAS